VPLFLEEPQLLAPFRRGERSCLERVYRTYVDHVCNLVRYGLHALRGNVHVAGPGAGEARDLVQETFARAFAERARLAYDGLRPYGPFLSTITRNLIVDHARRRNREITVDELPETVDPGALDVEPWAEPATVRSVEAYLAALSPELKRVHEERYVRSSTQEDAARALGVSRQQLRTLEKRLRQGLADHLRNQDRGEPVKVTERKAKHG
jgi:RNA polymerase sigma-70 factor (ECF subfamily)